MNSARANSKAYIAPANLKPRPTYQYEYPGIHRMLLWSLRALFFFLKEYDFIITSGYRCSVNNEQKGRSSTNHNGKAVDVDVALLPGEDKRFELCERCKQLQPI